jgi:hypothetical protein
MARWTPVPIVGGAYSDDTKPWSCQDTVNYIPVLAEREGARSAGILRSAPGYDTFCSSAQVAPVRGQHDVEGAHFAVIGDFLYRIGTSGSAASLGTIPGTGRVSMAHNQIAGGNELVIANGLSGYVYNTVTETLSQITDDGFPGFLVCDFVDGYIAGIDPSRRFWFHSNLAAATDYNTLDRYEAESQPDRLVALIVNHREALVFGERTAEFYRNAGTATGTFQRVDGTEMAVGCAATHAVARMDNSVFWLGSDGIVYRLDGYSPRRISTHAIEQAIAECDMSRAYAFTYEDRGHKVFYLTFPDGKTWGYDVASGEWHRRKSYGLDRWRLSTLVRSNGQWIGGDYSNGKLYRLDWDVQHEAGEEMEKRRITPALHDHGNRVTVNAAQVLVDTGVA